MLKHIKPFWNIDEVYSLEYEVPPDATRGFNLDMESDRLRYGSILTSNVYRGKLPSSLSSISDYFSELNNKAYAIHQMLPGSVLPYHNDKYSYYMQANQIQSINDIVRVIVFLENWKPGHLLEINGVRVPEWKCGDYVSWSGPTSHMAANLGHENRYTLQITGSV